MIMTSLVPRHFHRPVFDCFTVCENGGRRPGPFYHMNDVTVYLGKQKGGGSLTKRMHFVYRLCPEAASLHFVNIWNCKQTLQELVL